VIARNGHQPEVWERAKEEMTRILGERAISKTTISYSELVRTLVTIRFEPDSNALATMLGEISTEEDEHGRGMLSVLVVHKDGDKMPGPGFFDLAKRLGRDTTDRLAAWAQEMETVQRAWSRPSRRGHR
jgi:hypothetical protein